MVQLDRLDMSVTLYYSTGGTTHKTHCMSVGLYEMGRRHTGAALSGCQGMC